MGQTVFPVLNLPSPLSFSDQVTEDETNQYDFPKRPCFPVNPFRGTLLLLLLSVTG